MPIVAADIHVITGLTQSRTYVLSSLNVADYGVRMRVVRPTATDAYNATITYGSGPSTKVLAAGTWADFSFLLNFGWAITASGSL